MATATAMELQEAADAKMSSRQDTLAIIESLTLALLKEVARDADPSLSLVMYPLDPIVQNMMYDHYHTCPDLQGREKCGER